MAESHSPPITHSGRRIRNSRAVVSQGAEIENQNADKKNAVFKVNELRSWRVMKRRGGSRSDVLFSEGLNALLSIVVFWRQ